MRNLDDQPEKSRFYSVPNFSYNRAIPGRLRPENDDVITGSVKRAMRSRG